MSMHLRSCFLCLYFRRCIFKILQQKKNKLKSLMGPLLRLSLQQSQCLQACSDYLNLMSDFIFLKYIFFSSLRPVDLDLMKSSLSRMQSWALPDLTTCPTPTPFTCSVYTSVARVRVLSKHQGYIEPSSHCLLGWGQEYDLPLSGIFPLLPDQPVIVFESFLFACFDNLVCMTPLHHIANSTKFNYLSHHQLGGKHEPLEDWIFLDWVTCNFKSVWK